MGVTSREKAELFSYKLRDIYQIWYTQGRTIGQRKQILLSEKKLTKISIVSTIRERRKVKVE